MLITMEKLLEIIIKNKNPTVTLQGYILKLRNLFRNQLSFNF